MFLRRLRADTAILPRLTGRIAAAVRDEPYGIFLNNYAATGFAFHVTPGLYGRGGAASP